MELIRLLEIALAGWCLSYAVTSTFGPFNIFHWLQSNVPLGGLTNCIICLMPWICLVLWLVPDGVIIWAFASAGLGLLLHSYTGWRFNG